MPTLIPARHGIAAHLLKGQSIKIINTHGTQVVDTWAFTTTTKDSTMTPPALQQMSMQHCRASLGRVIPIVGDSLVSNERKPMLTIIEDTTPGIHDTMVAACDRFRYEELGAKGYHRNCADNLVEGLEAIGVTPPAFTPSPLNLFMNIPIQKDRSSILFEPPTSKAEQYVILKAEIDLVIALSACPQDLLTINCGNPVECFFEIL